VALRSRQSQTWSDLTPDTTGDVPLAYFWSFWHIGERRHDVVFGGFRDAQFEVREARTLNLVSLVWRRQQSPSAAQPLARESHVAFSGTPAARRSLSSAVIYNGAFLDDIWALEPRSGVWVRARTQRWCAECRAVQPQPQHAQRHARARSCAAPTARRAPTHSSTRRQCARRPVSTLACATARDACATAPATAARSAKRRSARPPVSLVAHASRPTRATAPMQHDKASRCTAASARAIVAMACCRRLKRRATTATASRATAAPNCRQRRSILFVDRRLACATSPSSAAAPPRVRPDTFANGPVCRPIAGPCDIAETCTGNSAACPADRYVNMNVVCRARAANNTCDIDDFCSGSAPSCPPDRFRGPGTACNSRNPCSTGDTCSATASCLSGTTTCNCVNGGDCDDNNPCTVDTCVNMRCAAHSRQ
jgi:hypothetical protein